MWQAQQIAAIQLAAAAAVMQQQAQQQQMALAMSAPPAYQLQQRPTHLAIDADPSDTEDDEDDEQLRTLFCGNLDERVTEDLLYEVFLQAGPLEAVRIPKDNHGKQRSFGFVTYIHRCSPPYAMELLAGLALYHRTLTIKFQGESSGARRRSLPSDCERYVSRQRVSDNSMLRSTSFPAFLDNSLNTAMAPLALPTPSNPFRNNSSEWTKGTSVRNRDNDRGRTAKYDSASTRPHHNSSPYQRTGDSSRQSSSNSGDSHDQARRRSGSEQQRRRQDDGDRRSDSHGRHRR